LSHLQRRRGDDQAWRRCRARVCATPPLVTQRWVFWISGQITGLVVRYLRAYPPRPATSRGSPTGLACGLPSLSLPPAAVQTASRTAPSVHEHARSREPPGNQPRPTGSGRCCGGWWVDGQLVCRCTVAVQLVPGGQWEAPGDGSMPAHGIGGVRRDVPVPSRRRAGRSERQAVARRPGGGRQTPCWRP
jgi:hypothetical protein